MMALFGWVGSGGGDMTSDCIPNPKPMIGRALCPGSGFVVRTRTVHDYAFA